MLICIPNENRMAEVRAAATPETAKKYISQGHRVTVQRNAGITATFPDDEFAVTGAEIVDEATAFGAELVLKVRAPIGGERALLERGTVLVGMLDPFDRENAILIATTGVTGFALEAAPHTTRAQSLDVLSSQANIAGYKAVLIAAHHYPHFAPMLMTAAGTVKAACVLVLGAGVARLQAIATAKRLGAVIEASDARPAVREQVESLGAKFLDVPYETDDERDAAVGVGGYARPMPPSWLPRQEALVHERARQADIATTTALIPGRGAPTLIPIDAVQAMKPEAVRVDLAAGRGAEYEGRKGGNCPLIEADGVVVKRGVTIVGYTNLAAMVPADASALYAHNLLDFLKLMPIIDAYKARTVIVNKRSMAAGYTGLDNDLFYMNMTMMVFGDAKKVIEQMVKVAA